jgi:hypothetical protein
MDASRSGDDVSAGEGVGGREMNFEFPSQASLSSAVSYKATAYAHYTQQAYMSGGRREFTSLKKIMFSITFLKRFFKINKGYVFFN